MNNSNLILKALEEALKKLDYPVDNIRLTKSEKFSDFSSNIALILQKKINKTSLEIAENIKNTIDYDKFLIKKIEIAKPGFLNFFVKNNFFVDVINKIIKKNEKYGAQNQNQKINIEFVSANPTGFLHVGHARGAAIGSTLANILTFTGNKVIKEFYVNDAGNQIERLAISVLLRYKQLFDPSVKMIEDCYMGEDIIFAAKKIKQKYNDKFQNKSIDDKEIIKIFKNESINIMLKEIKKDLSDFNVFFDRFSSEKTLYQNNEIQNTLNSLSDTYIDNKALWLKTTKYGDDKDRVLVKNDGKYTYFAPDIAYHKQKINADGGIDKLINIWGSDHIGYIKRMEIALEILGFSKDKVKILTCQIVRFLKNGELFKMSKRQGTSFTIKDLLKVVNKDSMRFFMLHRSENSVLDFDINLALEQSSKNPVFSIQYSYARICQLLLKTNIQEFLATSFENELELKLINNLKIFPELIDKISKNYKINLLTEYLLNLSKDFNTLYSNTKFINNPNEKSLIALAKATQIVLKIGLDLIGVSSPERM
ncbi:arginine--tRNA ligase [Mesomycoplasma neurolyticum]|uniref:Arginine--tRNA ligase n=1 Tax=Mesomycoplasma neurolyticum TaxID=2120 RepID=A0A449A626_9BACT|nr:arginine--tRNA ligase [Mesomycoplasma neurolyticum]VEU59688.1 Arginyl-tRNA synthetase [Mesomycoplasma neurolyticum]